MKKSIILLLLLFSAINIYAKTNIYVSVLPLKYFVQQIAGNKVKVKVMVGPGQSPETYAPTPQQMQQLSQTQIYYRVGVPFEQAWMGKIQAINPKMQIVDLRQGIKLRPDDPHIWTDPLLVMQMAKTIRDSLIATDPAHKKSYQQNYLRFIKSLQKLNQQIKAKLSNLNNKTFLVFHPAWGYFAARYGLQQLAIEQEGKPSGPQDLQNIIHQAKLKRINLLLVQPQFSRTQAQMIAKIIHAKVVATNPLAEDYIENMGEITNIFVQYLGN